MATLMTILVLILWARWMTNAKADRAHVRRLDAQDRLQRQLLASRRRRLARG